jgi:hypothetical protein
MITLQAEPRLIRLRPVVFQPNLLIQTGRPPAVIPVAALALPTLFLTLLLHPMVWLQRRIWLPARSVMVHQGQLNLTAASSLQAAQPHFAIRLPALIPQTGKGAMTVPHHIFPVTAHQATVAPVAPYAMITHKGEPLLTQPRPAVFQPNLQMQMVQPQAAIQAGQSYLLMLFLIRLLRPTELLPRRI